MKPIAIITFHSSHNSGSMLQAYALQNKLKELGYENDIIDFSNDGQRKLYSVMPSVVWHGFVRKTLILRWLKTLPYYFILENQKKFYLDFKSSYLDMTFKEYRNNKELCSENFEYSYYITGSDQVWNIKCIDADDAYFLNFVKKGIKIAYAVSLGANIIKNTTDNVNKYREYIMDFNYISVRETNAVAQISDLGGKNVEMCIDPTLFYNQNEWEAHLPVGDRIVKEEYIFYYAFSYSDEVNKTVVEISRKYKLPVYIMDARVWGPMDKKKNGFKLCGVSGPLAFLNLMKYAKLSLTTSFHGTVFSVIFQKKFWFIDSSMHSEQDDRASSLLKQLGLMDKLIYGDKLLESNIFQDIHYEHVYENIRNLQENAIAFLHKSVK